MLKKMGLLVAGTLLSMQVMAVTTSSMPEPVQIAMDKTLPAYGSDVIPNVTPFTIIAECTVSTSNPSASQVRVTLLEGSGEFNGRKVETGAYEEMAVGNGFKFTIIANNDGAKVQLENMSAYALSAHCNVTFKM